VPASGIEHGWRGETILSCRHVSASFGSAPSVFTAGLAVVLPSERPELRGDRIDTGSWRAASFFAAPKITTAAFVRIWRLPTHASSARIFSILDRHADMNFRIAASDRVCKTGTRGFCSASNALHLARQAEEKTTSLSSCGSTQRGATILSTGRGLWCDAFIGHMSQFHQLFKGVSTFGRAEITPVR
jgi:hypothetical protein